MTRPDQEAAPLADDGWNRLSPWGIGTRVIKAVPSLIPALIGVFFLGRAAGPVFFVIAGVAISVLVGLLPWLTTRWRVTEDQLELRHGLVRKVSATARRDRIRSVDVTAGPIERALKLAPGEAFIVDSLGWVEFRGRRLIVGPGVFVPRRRTELLAELADGRGVLVELCCGAGPVAATAAAATTYAADIDRTAAGYAAPGVRRGCLLAGGRAAGVADGRPAGRRRRRRVGRPGRGARGCRRRTPSTRSPRAGGTTSRRRRSRG